MDLTYAWLASIASGVTPIVIKASSKNLIKDPWLFNLLWVGFGIPLVVVWAIIKGGGMPHNWMPIFLLSLSSACFYLFYTVSLYKLDVTTVSPLFSLRTVFAVLLGLLLLHEHISSVAVALIIVIIAANTLTAYDENLKFKAFLQKPILLAVIGMAALALMGFFTNKSVKQNGYASTILWQDTLTFILLLPTILLAKEKGSFYKLSKLKPFILLGLTGFIYTVTSVLAFAHNLALSSVIVSLPLSMVFAFVLSRLNSNFLETHSLKVYAVRFLGAIITVGCAIRLSFIR